MWGRRRPCSLADIKLQQWLNYIFNIFKWINLILYNIKVIWKINLYMYLFQTIYMFKKWIKKLKQRCSASKSQSLAIIYDIVVQIINLILKIRNGTWLREVLACYIKGCLLSYFGSYHLSLVKTQKRN